MRVQQYMLAAACVCLVMAGVSQADVPGTIHFQGVLTDDLGSLLDGTYSVTFAIYNSESGGSPLWFESQSVDADNGLFSVMLGAINPINLEFSGQRWLGVTLPGDTEMEPRYAFSSVPYALWAATSDSALAISWDDISGVPGDIADGDDIGGGVTQIDTSGPGILVHDPTGPTATLSLNMGHGNGIDADMLDGEEGSAYATDAELSATGTINAPGNPVDWTKLKGVPAGFADSVDNVGGSGDGHSLDAADGAPVDALYCDDEGNVGIGTDTPSFVLDVAGAVGIDGYLHHNGDHDTYVVFGTDRLEVHAGGNKLFTASEATQDAVIVNDDSHDVDFRVESDTNDHSLFVQGTNGMVGFGTSLPTQQVDVNGTVQTLGFRMPTGAATGHVLTSDAGGVASWAAPSGGLPAGALGNTLWHDGGNWVADDDLYNNGSGKIGIGTVTPSHSLEVGGDAGFDNYLIHNDDTDTKMYFSEDQIDFYAGNVKLLTLDESATDQVVINEDGNNSNLRVESDVLTYALFVRGTDGHVGIGTSSPDHPLEVAADIGLGANLVHNDDTDTYLGFTTDQLDIFTGGLKMLTLDESTADVVIINENSADIDFRVESDNNSNALFVQGSDGFVGIGGGTPTYALDVAGNVGLNEFIYHNGDPDTYYRFYNDQFVMYAGGRSFINVSEGTQDVFTVNASAYDVDFKVSTDNDYYTLFVEGSDDQVGIGTDTPAHKLHVETASGNAVYGENTASDRYGYLGGGSYGAYGYSGTAGTYGYLGSDSYGVYGRRLGTSGYAVYSYRDDTETTAGSEHSVYGYMASDEPGASFETSKSTIKAYSPAGIEVSASDDNFLFGVEGDKRYAAPRMGGGVLGIIDDTDWGSLGYTNSGGTDYGGYFFGGTLGDQTKQDGARQRVGFGSYGGLLGGWARGDVYGFYASGERYASYTNGNSFTNGYEATLHDVGGTERVATFTATSVDVDVYAHGIGELVNGKASVTFDRDFLSLVSDQIPVTVTVTPVGAPAGLLCITEKTSDSFSVGLLEIPGLKGGRQDISFDWIAIGRRAGFETRPEVPEELKARDFDANMSEFAVQEIGMDRPAKPMWYDGVSLRWDTPPERPISAEKLKNLEEDRLEVERHEAEHRRMLEGRKRMLDTQKRLEAMSSGEEGMTSQEPVDR